MFTYQKSLSCKDITSFQRDLIFNIFTPLLVVIWGCILVMVLIACRITVPDISNGSASGLVFVMWDSSKDQTQGFTPIR